MRVGRAVAAVAVVGLVAALTGCILPDNDVESDPGTLPPDSGGGSLTLEDLTAVLSENDVPDTTLLSADGTISVSGDDLAAEQDYWSAVGGRPEECADIVAGPYLVNSHDTGDRLDDPSALLATVTETDEDRFGLMQVYARQFDDTATARAFLTEFEATVAGCDAYQLVDGDTVTWDATRLSVEQLEGAPAGVAALHYTETLRDSSALESSTTFLQRGRIVISVFAEITSSSTMTSDDAVGLAAAIAVRLDLL